MVGSSTLSLSSPPASASFGSLPRTPVYARESVTAQPRRLPSSRDKSMTVKTKEVQVECKIRRFRRFRTTKRNLPITGVEGF
jgi:hypothetical protein